MAQVLIIGVLALFLQLTAGQDACTNARTTLSANIASCTATAQNPTIICSGVCRGYYDDIFESCSPAQALVQQQLFDAVCGDSTPATAGPTTASTTDDSDDQQCLDAFGTLAINAARCTPTDDNPNIICSGECRGYFEDYLNSCPADEVADEQQQFNQMCGSSGSGASTIKGLGIFSVLLSMIAAVVF